MGENTYGGLTRQGEVERLAAIGKVPVAAVVYQ